MFVYVCPTYIIITYVITVSAACTQFKVPVFSWNLIISHSASQHGIRIWENMDILEKNEPYLVVKIIIACTKQQFGRLWLRNKTEIIWIYIDLYMKLSNLIESKCLQMRKLGHRVKNNLTLFISLLSSRPKNQINELFTYSNCKRFAKIFCFLNFIYLYETY